MLGAIPFPNLLKHPLLDMKLGFALMRDRRVPLRSKGVALLMGLTATAMVEFLELPVEGVLSMLLPILGIAGDALLDGAELIAGPLLLANLFLPFVAPRHIVDLIRAERSPSTGGPKTSVVDI